MQITEDWNIGIMGNHEYLAIFFCEIDLKLELPILQQS